MASPEGRLGQKPLQQGDAWGYVAYGFVDFKGQDGMFRCSPCCGRAFDPWSSLAQLGRAQIGQLDEETKACEPVSKLADCA